MLYASEFLRYCVEVRSLAPKTVEAYAEAVEDLERTVKIDDPRKISTRDIDHYMSRRWLLGSAASSRKTRLSSVKAFFRYLFTRGYIDEDPSAAVLPPRTKRGTIPTFTEHEIEQMIFRATMPAPVKGRRENDFSFARRRRMCEVRFDRDTALIALAYSNALRAIEIGLIRNEHYWIDGTGIPALVVMASKSSSEPTRMRVDRAVAQLIDRWMLRRNQHGIVSEYVFCSVVPEMHGGLQPGQIRNILRDRARLAGISLEKRRVSPHVLRYSRATHMYAATKDIVAVSTQLRHAKIETTMDYIRLGSLSAQAKVATNSLPWNRRGVEGLV